MTSFIQPLPEHSITTETPAERARQAVAKYRAQCNEDVYHTLLGIIEAESAKGACSETPPPYYSVALAHGITRDEYHSRKRRTGCTDCMAGYEQ